MALMTAERIPMPGEVAQAENREREGENKKIIIVKTAHQREAALPCRQEITTKEKKLEQN